MEKKLIRKNDIILLGGLLFVLAVITLIVFLTRQAGAEVVVCVDGQEVAAFPLDVDTTYEIEGAGGGRNLLVIEGGQAYLSDASCPDLLCVHMGKISRAGQSIICLPNKVTVEIRGKEKSEEYDTIVG